MWKICSAKSISIGSVNSFLSNGKKVFYNSLLIALIIGLLSNMSFNFRDHKDLVFNLIIFKCFQVANQKQP